MYHPLKTAKKMKKTYIHPQTWAVELETSNIIALSLGVDTSGSQTLDGESDWLSREGGWSSENWSEAEEDFDE